MSTTGPGGEWDPDDTGAVPVGPEPEPTGAGGAGSGGWGEAPRTEPFAVAALVWAIVSIVLPIVGTIVAFVLAQKASDSIKDSRGTRSGSGLVIAARAVAGAVIVLWAIGLILFFALRDDDSDNSNVAVPTQPPIESTTTEPPPTTLPTTLPPPTTQPPPVTTEPVAPTTSIVPPPPTEPPPPTTVAPTTTPTTEPPPTTTEPPPTTAPPPTTTPERGEEVRIQNQLLKTTGPANRRIGPSNRGVPDDERVVVTYVPGQALQIVWAINAGDPPLPEGEPQCTAPPEPPSSTTTTTTDPPDPSDTVDPESTTTTAGGNQPDPDSTPQRARREARNILNEIRFEIEQKRLNIDGVQLIGRFPIAGAEEGDVDVVQVFYTNDDVKASWPYAQAFTAPPADAVQCLDPTFD